MTSDNFCPITWRGIFTMNLPVDVTCAVYVFEPIVTIAVENGSAVPKTPVETAVTACVTRAGFGA